MSEEGQEKRRKGQGGPWKGLWAVSSFGLYAKTKLWKALMEV